MTALACVGFLATAACGGPPETSRGWRHTFQYGDSSELGVGLARVSALGRQLVEDGYRRGSSATHATNSPVEAERIERHFLGEEPTLGEVEIVLWWWDTVRPDDEEIGVGLVASVPADAEGDRAWDELRVRLRDAIRSGSR